VQIARREDAKGKGGCELGREEREREFAYHSDLLGCNNTQSKSNPHEDKGERLPDGV
jgi:hypothetical protein